MGSLRDPAVQEQPRERWLARLDPTAGGTSELINSIQNPNNPSIDVPSWQYITSTGNVNSSGVENAINA